MDGCWRYMQLSPQPQHMHEALLSHMQTRLFLSPCTTVLTCCFIIWLRVNLLFGCDRAGALCTAPVGSGGAAGDATAADPRAGLGVGEKQGAGRKVYGKHSDKLGSREAKVTDYPTKRLAALKNLNDFLSKHPDSDPVLAWSFYENAMACEGNAISGKESQKHLDSMRFEHPPAILASWEAVPGFVDSGIKVLPPNQDYLDYQRTEKAMNDQSAVTSFAELGPTVDLSAADNKQTKYDLTAKMAPGIGNRYARAVVYTGQQCVFNDDDFRATDQGQAIKVKCFGEGQGYSPSRQKPRSGARSKPTWRSSASGPPLRSVENI